MLTLFITKKIPEKSGKYFTESRYKSDMQKDTTFCDFRQIVPEIIMVLSNSSVLHEVGIIANRTQK